MPVLLLTTLIGAGQRLILSRLTAQTCALAGEPPSAPASPCVPRSVPAPPLAVARVRLLAARQHHFTAARRPQDPVSLARS